MNKIIRLSRYVFDKDHIQHNITISVSSIFEIEEKLANERIHIITTLLESLFPNTMTIVSLSLSAHRVTEEARSLKNLELSNRDDLYSEGNEITLEQLRGLMIHCYSNGLEFELDVIDIKNQHITVVVNKDLLGYHYLYGTPETFTKEYLNTVKKKLKDCTFSGSFSKTL